MARMADLPQAPLLRARCRLRGASWALGEGIPSRVSPSAMRRRPLPANHSAKMRSTTGVVGFEASKPLADCGLARVWVGPCVGKLVAVRGSAAQEPALGGGLFGHGGPDPDLDAVPLALAHAPVQAHDQIVGLGSGVDATADLGHPQLDAV